MRALNFTTPGVYGLNTQDEIAVDTEQARFATEALNGVVDTTGKLVSRKNFLLVTSGVTATTKFMYTHKNADGTETILTASSNQIFSGTTTLTARRTAASVTTPNWQIASLSGKILLAQAGEPYYVMTEGTFASNAITASGTGGPGSNAVNVILAAYGRAWAAVTATNKQTIWWSNLLDGTTWSTGDSGNISLINAWPAGADTIVALSAAFGRLFILGRNSILMYTLPSDNDPASMTLTDTVSNLGCIARDSVRVTDDGVYFLSDNGVYRINKLGQVTALITLPLVSKLCNDDILAAIAAETATNIRSGYDPKEGLYLLSFPTPNKTFVFHTRRVIPDVDAPVVTVWNNVGQPFWAFTYDATNLYCGGKNGVHRYSGYTPATSNEAYTFRFYSQWNNFGDESREKHAKTAMLTLRTVSGLAGSFLWQEDFDATTTFSTAFTTETAEFAEAPGIGNVEVEAGGSFNAARIGCSFAFTTATSNQVALHGIKLYAAPGAIKAR